MYQRAIVRKPTANFAAGLTTQNLGVPSFELALAQHAAYCEALRACGLSLIELEGDDRFPDATFVEDTAVLTPRCAVLARPGAPTRLGEVESVRDVLIHHFPCLYAIQPPGTLDGGDVCQADDHFFIGVSRRTNREGAEQLAEILEREGYTYSLVDIREKVGILHLKSGIAYLGEGKLVIVPELSGHHAFRGYELWHVPAGEEYAANCVLVNGRVLIAAGFPRFQAMLEQGGCEVLPLDVSEFRKMDGGLSCLSLRF